MQIGFTRSLPSLHGLEALNAIGGHFSISRNEELVSLDGLAGLTSIGTFFSIRRNDVLTNIAGLSNLQSINGYLFIFDNALLTSLVGLENLNSTTIQVPPVSKANLHPQIPIRSLLDKAHDHPHRMTGRQSGKR